VGVSSVDDGFSAGAYVGVYEPSSEEAGAFDGFFVGMLVFSFPPPSSSNVGLLVGVFVSPSSVGDVGVYVGKVGKLDVTFEAIAVDSDDGRDVGSADGLILGCIVGVVVGDTVGVLVGAPDGETVGADVVGGTVVGLIVA
jgi:hypothetical protein